jgi:hypothetical protein
VSESACYSPSYGPFAFWMGYNFHCALLLASCIDICISVGAKADGDSNAGERMESVARINRCEIIEFYVEDLTES